jgi:large subunit ribosomal protein L1
VRTGLNVRHADEQLRVTISFPNGLGKEQKVAVFARATRPRRPRTPARTSSAPRTSPRDRGRLRRLRRCDRDAGHDAGGRPPRPHPRPERQDAEPEGRHVTQDVAKAVSESKAGRVEYRTDRTAIVHLSIGKVSFDERKLLENYAALIDELVRAKPAAAKGRYLRTITLTTTMGPGIKVDPTRTRDILEEQVPAAAE